MFDRWVSEAILAILRLFVDIEWESLKLTLWSGKLSEGYVSEYRSPVAMPPACSLGFRATPARLTNCAVANATGCPHRGNRTLVRMSCAQCAAAVPHAAVGRSSFRMAHAQGAPPRLRLLALPCSTSRPSYLAGRPCALWQLAKRHGSQLGPFVPIDCVTAQKPAGSHCVSLHRAASPFSPDSRHHNLSVGDSVTMRFTHKQTGAGVTFEDLRIR